MKEPVLFLILQGEARANGGLESISQVMARLKHYRPIVLTNLETSFSHRWREAGIEVHVVAEQASQGLLRNPAAILSTYRRYHRQVWTILQASGARIVHFNDPLAFQLGLLPAKLCGAALVLNLRDTLEPARKPPRLRYRLIFAAADHVLYLSEDMAERWRGIAPNAASSFSVTYSIVDPERFAPAPAGERDDPPVVLVPSIFWPKKGQLEFIRHAVPALASRGIETWFAGDFEPATEPYARKCAVAAAPFSGHVRFLGYQAGMADLYARAAVIAVPSRHEGLMRGMIEAMSCGRAVVSFDVCSARELLEEKSRGAGEVVNQGNYAGMAEALIRFAMDPLARAAAGAAGVAAARELFDPDRVIERHERAYRHSRDR
ncbi:glycosyltransferase family 4 protein [Sphingomonas sp. URHD0057]|uniref:glycosyltransferase family 4 protein n=1 Tax=Sphingomonas sp. URHD0057 TaxID=1380389 RepID=UPI0006875DFA|nr:glycosyltransferase family 4 protein [Sphingomonas sp. URHD0057]